MAAHRFRFYRAGGVDQVRLTTGADLLALRDLDQKLWVALSCPVTGLEFDERTLALIDADNDGRVRAPELLGAIDWARSVLTDIEELARPSDPLPLAAIDTEASEGKLLLETARSLLVGLGKPHEESLSIADAKSALEAFGKQPANGDGVVPVLHFGSEEVKKVAAAILETVPEPKNDRSGEPGLTRSDIVDYFVALREVQKYQDAGTSPEVLPLGEHTALAFSNFAAVREKIEDFFARVGVLEFDERALVGMNREEAGYATLGEKLLSPASPELLAFPVARVRSGAALPLATGLNPAWAGSIGAFRDTVVEPLLGKRDELTREDFEVIRARLRGYADWVAARPTSGLTSRLFGSPPELLAELRRFADADGEARLLAIIAEDEAAAERAGAVERVEKLVHFKRDLLRLANNFVSFRDFYQPGATAIFQIGTLFIDQRSLDMVMRVNDVAKHVSLAPLSSMYLLYCDAKNVSGKTMQIVAAVTNGDVDNLMVGRNGVFYDRSGKDWDATVTRIVEAPISIRQAFWSPYKKLVRLIEEQVNKRAAAAQAEADANIATKAQTVDAVTQGDVKKPAEPPKKLDIGVVAAIGVAVGGITAALGVFLQAFLGLGVWMPLGIVGLFLVISGPAMAVAWLKLRRRNFGPLLDANGWAVNVLPRVNIPLGQSLTRLARLPDGASRDLVDPFAEKKTPWWRMILTLVLVTAGVLWFLGALDRLLPADYQSVTVLGEAAPAKIKAKDEQKALPTPPPAPPKAP